MASMDCCMITTTFFAILTFSIPAKKENVNLILFLVYIKGLYFISFILKLFPFFQKPDIGRLEFFAVEIF